MKKLIIFIILACLFIISTNTYGQPAGSKGVSGIQGSLYIATARAGTLFVDFIAPNDSLGVIITAAGADTVLLKLSQLQVNDTLFIGIGRGDTNLAKFYRPTRTRLDWQVNNNSGGDTTSIISADKFVSDEISIDDTLFFDTPGFNYSNGILYRTTHGGLRWRVKNNSGGDTLSTFQVNKLVLRDDTIAFNDDTTTGTVQELFYVERSGSDTIIFFKHGTTEYNLLAPVVADSLWDSINVKNRIFVEGNILFEIHAPTARDSSGGLYLDSATSTLMWSDGSNNFYDLLTFADSSADDITVNDTLYIKTPTSGDSAKLFMATRNRLHLQVNNETGGDTTSYFSTDIVVVDEISIDDTLLIDASGFDYGLGKLYRSSYNSLIYEVANNTGGDTLAIIQADKFIARKDTFVFGTTTATQKFLYVDSSAADDTLKYSDGTTVEYIVKDTINAVVEVSYFPKMPNTMFYVDSLNAGALGTMGDSLISVSAVTDSAWQAAGNYHTPVYKFQSFESTSQNVNMLVTFPIPYNFDSWESIYISGNATATIASASCSMTVDVGKNFSSYSDEKIGYTSVVTIPPIERTGAGGVTNLADGFIFSADDLDNFGKVFVPGDIFNLRFVGVSKNGFYTNIHRIWFRYYKKNGM